MSRLQEFLLNSLGIFIISLITILVTFVLFLFSQFPLMLKTKSVCLENGYPEYNVTWNYKAYCVRTINQTQYVVPLKNILGEK